MSIALFPEPIEVEIVKAQWDMEVLSQGLLLGIEQVEGGESWGYVVNKEGLISQENLSQCRTKWRYDAALGDWDDHSGGGFIEEPDVPSRGPD